MTTLISGIVSAQIQKADKAPLSHGGVELLLKDDVGSEFRILLDGATPFDTNVLHKVFGITDFDKFREEYAAQKERAA